MTDTPKDKAPLYGALLFLGASALYLITLAPTVTFWDSGELVAASFQLGIPHQPGYPIFCLAGRLFSFLPIGSAAYRVNLLSATFSAMSVLLVYLALLELSSGRLIPALLALMLASLRAFWSQAVVAEVYALNGFFVCMLVFLHFRARHARLSEGRYVALSGFVFGLGVVNHMSLALYLPALLISWASLPSVRRAGWLSTGLFFVLLGLSLYIYLPIRSLAGPGLNIGHPDTWQGFARVVRWGEYLRQAKSLPASVSSMAGDIRHIGPALAVATFVAFFLAWRLLRRDWRLYLPPVVFLGIYVAGISTQVMGSEAAERFGLAAKFYIPAFILLIIIIGAEAADLFGTDGGRRLRIPATIFFGACALYLAFSNFRPNDYSRNFIAYDYAVNSLNSAGERGVLLTWGDNGAFPLWYVQQVELYRDDVALVHTPLMTYGWYLDDVEETLGVKAGFLEPYLLGENAFRIFKAVSPGRPVAYDYSTTHFLEMDMGKLTAQGLVYFEGPVPPGDPWRYYVFRGVDDPGVFKGPMERNIIAIYGRQRKLLGERALPRPD